MLVAQKKKKKKRKRCFFVGFALFSKDSKNYFYGMSYSQTFTSECLDDVGYWKNWMITIQLSAICQTVSVSILDLKSRD